jgi:hypothetical protein
MIKTIYKDVELDVELSDFSDRDLIEELTDRESISLNTIMNYYLDDQADEVLTSIDFETMDMKNFESMFKEFMYRLRSDKAEALKQIVDNSYHFARD